jgi:hypothetical protein
MPRCEAVIASSIRVCPHCEYVYPPEEKKLETGTMLEFKQEGLIGLRVNDLTIDQMVELCKSKRRYNVKYNVLWQILKSRGYSHLNEYSKKMGYKYGWVIRQQQETRVIKFNNIQIQWAKPKNNPQWR